MSIFRFKFLKKKHLLQVMNIWPPLMGAGIRIKVKRPDLKEVLVEMKQRFWNTSFIDRHFGGSLYTMTDPFYMIMLIENLGKQYKVIDKQAEIKYLKAAKGKVWAKFVLTDELISSIKEKLKVKNSSADIRLKIPIESQQGVVAEVTKVLFIKKIHSLEGIEE